MKTQTYDGKKRGNMNTLQYLRSLEIARPRVITDNILIYDRVDFETLVSRELINTLQDRMSCPVCHSTSTENVNGYIDCLACGCISDDLDGSLLSY